MLVFLMLFACADSDDNGTVGTPPGFGQSEDNDREPNLSGQSEDTGHGLSVGDPVQRIVLHEAFSGSNCGPCAPAAENIKAALTDKAGQYTMLKYQLGSDPYITREAVDRRMLYLPDAETYSIPWIVADGIHEFHPNEMNHGGVYTAADFDELVNHSAFLQVDVAASINGQSLSIEVELWPSIDFSGDDLRLLVAIKEGTTLNNVGSNGQTEFHDVFKKFVPDQGGTPLPNLIAGEAASYTFEYTFAGEYQADTAINNMVDHNAAHTVEDFDDLSVVAWVQDMTTWEVFNAGMSASE